jgi:hypothetical protein
LSSSVAGSDSERMTGSSDVMNGTRSSIAVLIDEPRPARALP